MINIPKDDFSIAISVAAGTLKKSDIRSNKYINSLIKQIKILFDSGKLSKYAIHGSVINIQKYVNQGLK